jgi:glutathione S-transferase
LAERKPWGDDDVLTVWGRKTSVNVQKVMWAVAELGIAHTRIDAGGPFGGLDTVEFGKLNPNRLVPVIEDEHGFRLYESNAIVRYLSRTHGWGTLAPSDERDRALADQWMDWSLTALYGDIIGTLFVGLVRTPLKDRNQQTMDAAAKRVGEKLKILDAQLGGKQFILGDQLTMADIAVGAQMYRYFTLDIVRPELASVEAWYRRMAARKTYQDHVMVDYQAMKVPGA